MLCWCICRWNTMRKSFAEKSHLPLRIFTESGTFTVHICSHFVHYAAMKYNMDFLTFHFLTVFALITIYYREYWLLCIHSVNSVINSDIFKLSCKGLVCSRPTWHLKQSSRSRLTSWSHQHWNVWTWSSTNWRKLYMTAPNGLASDKCRLVGKIFLFMIYHSE